MALIIKQVAGMQSHAVAKFNDLIRAFCRIFCGILMPEYTN